MTERKGVSMGDERIREICEEFRAVCSVPYNDRLRAYKQKGGRIIGTLYNQVPEELIYAAGFQPVRLRAIGSTGTEASAARFTQVNCSLIKHFYDSAAKGRFDFVDGIVATNGCDHIRKLEENWNAVLKPAYAYMICFPKRFGDDLQVAHLAQEIAQFKADFEAHFGVQVTDEALKDAIVLFNQKRALQMRLYELRKRPNPPISGADALAANIASTCMPLPEYIALMTELLEACEAAEGIADYRARVVVYGGEIDSVELFDAIESQGALIVADSLGGYGRRSADMQVSTEGDLIANLAAAYLQGRPTEPRLHGTRADRWAYLEKVAQEAGAQGFILVHIPICDLWGYERYMFDVEVANKGFKCLDLDTEYIFSATGQTRTRVQAFVETLTEGGR